jgi:hypothetical protein
MWKGEKRMNKRRRETITGLRNELIRTETLYDKLLEENVLLQDEVKYLKAHGPLVALEPLTSTIDVLSHVIASLRRG